MADKEIKAEATVVLNTRDVDAAAQRVKRANDGVAKDAKKAAAQQASGQKKLTKEQEREAKKRADAERKLLERQAADAKKATDAQAREYERYQERLTRLHRDEVAKRAQQELASERKSLASREKLARETVKRIKAFSGGAVAAGVAGGAVAVNTARSIAGVQDTGTRVQQANQFRDTIAAAGRQAGMSEQQVAGMESNAIGVAKARSIDPMAVAGALEVGQGEFNALEFLNKKLDVIAKAATATGSDFSDFTTTMLQARQQLNLSDDEFDQAISILVAAQDKGAVAVKDFSRDYQELFGVFAASLGVKGLDGFKTVVGTAQTMKTLGKGHAESSTMGTRLAQRIALPETQQALGGILGMSAGAVGKLPLSELVDKLAVSEKWKKAGLRKKAFGDVEPMMAMETLVRQRQRSMAGDTSAIDLKGMESLSTEAGRASIENQFGGVSKSGSFLLNQKAVEAFDGTLTELDDMNAQLLKVNEAGNWLEKSLGSLAVWADSIKAAGVGALAAKLFGSLGSGGAAAGGAATAGEVAVGTAATGGLMTALGTGAAAAGAGALTAGITVGAAAGGGIGYGIDKLVEAVLDKKLSAYIGEALPNSDVTKARESALRGGSNEATTQLMRANKHLERIANAQDRKTAQPGSGNRGAR